jgi:hypothetical protein
MPSSTLRWTLPFAAFMERPSLESRLYWLVI